MKSVEQRLHLGLSVSLVLLLGLFWWVVSAAISHLTTEFVASRLQHDGETIIAALSFAPDGQPLVAPARINVVFERPFSGHYYVLQPEGGDTLRSRSLWDMDLSISPVAVGATTTWNAAGPSGQQLLVWSGGFRKQGSAFTLAVAEDFSPLAASLHRFHLYFAVLMVSVLVVTIGLQHLVVRRSFASLRRVREDIRALEEGDVAQLTEDVPTEVQPVVAEVNRLLAVVGQRLQRSRNATGNLAHALKGPLHLLAQLGRSEALRDHPELAAELEQHTGRIRQLMERELRRARLAGGGAPGQRFEPTEEMPGLVDVLERIYSERGLRIQLHFEGPERPTRTDRDDMLELLGNLLDNACKWAKQRVRCSLDTSDGFALSVEDDGPGCSPEELQQLTGRGVRIDESVAGHGLGLAIVKDIVTLYDGQLEFDRSPALGGLRVRVTLPGV